MVTLKTCVLAAVFLSGVSGSMYCPNPLDILPCKCKEVFGESLITCEHIHSEEKLEKVFSAYFPKKKIHQFTMTDSYLKTLSRNVFGDISFEVIDINHSNIESIREAAFSSSISTLQQLFITQCSLTHETFPFSTLDHFTRLKEARFTSNDIEIFPQIKSTSLTFLSLSMNPIKTLPPEAFNILPSLRYFYISRGELTNIERDVFKGSGNLQILDFTSNGLERVTGNMFGRQPSVQTLSLAGNKISSIKRGSFAGFPNLEELDLFKNQLTSLRPDVFAGLGRTNMYLQSNRIRSIASNAFSEISNSYIVLEYNKIRLLAEEWLRPLLERNNSVALKGNPNECGCEIAWLVQNRNFVTQVSGYCPNGTPIKRLDPQYYEQEC